MGGIKNILTGWGKHLGLLDISKDEKDLSEARLIICEKCEFAEESQILVILNGDGRYIDSLYCKKCTCPCVEKSLVAAEECPMHKW